MQRGGMAPLDLLAAYSGACTLIHVTNFRIAPVPAETCEKLEAKEIAGKEFRSAFRSRRRPGSLRLRAAPRSASLRPRRLQHGDSCSVVSPHCSRTVGCRYVRTSRIRAVFATPAKWITWQKSTRSLPRTR